MSNQDNRCPNEEQLAEFAAGRGEEDAAEALADHLSGCIACRAKVAELGELDETSKTLLAERSVTLPLIEKTVEEVKPEALDDRSLTLPLGEQTVEESVEERPKVERTQAIGPSEKTSAEAGSEKTLAASPSQPEALPKLKQVGEYELLEQLGAGGMGAVYKARHAELGTVYAIKLLHPGRVGDRVATERFQREMVAIGQLDHPNIVRAVDAGEDGALLYLVMEYVKGTDLSAIVHAHGPLEIADACEVVRQAAVGLGYVHRTGRVHRDIKPSNLMLTGEGTVKLLDLGLARFGDVEEEPPSPEEMEKLLQDVPVQANLTLTNQVMGTLEYIAPEQVTDSHSVDARADIYSLGCTLYKLLTGQSPFSGPRYSTTVKQMMAHTSAPVPPIRDLRSDVPEDLAEIIERMLAKVPEDRYATGAEVAEALAPHAALSSLERLAELSGAAPKNGRGRRGASEVTVAEMLDERAEARNLRSPWGFFAIFGGLLAVCVGLLALMLFNPNTRRPGDSNADHESGKTSIASDGESKGDVEKPVALTPVDLLSLIDLPRDAPPGHWQSDAKGLASLGQHDAKLQFPYQPPGSYRIEATVERLEKEVGTIKLGLIVGGRQCLVMIDAWHEEGYLTGPHRLNGKSLKDLADQAHRGQVVPAGKPVRLTCQVEHTGDRVVLRLDRDGQEVFTWRGQHTQLGLEARRKPRAGDVLFLSVYNSRMRFSELQVVPLSPGGRSVVFTDPANDPDRAAAQRVLWKGGRVTVAQSPADRPNELTKLASLGTRVVVKTIDLRGNAWFTAEDLNLFSNLSNLRSLDLSETSLAGRDLEHLSGLPQLASLAVAHTGVQTVGANFPKAAPNLSRLDLTGTAVSDAGLKSVGAMANLTELDLNYTSVTDAGLTHLQQLKGLKRLRLAFTGVKGTSAVATLEKLPALESISLAGTGVDDAAVDQLAKLKGLKQLGLLGTRLSAEAAGRLRKQLPNCKVVVGFVPLDVLAALDPGDLPGGGSWEFVDGALMLPDGGPAKLATPLVPPEEYDLHAVVQRHEGRDSLVFTLMAGGRPFMVGFDHWPGEGFLAAIHGIDGNHEKNSDVKLRGQSLPVGKDVTLDIQVRRGKIAVLRDGEKILEWEGDFHRLQPHYYYLPSATPSLGLAGNRCRIAIRELTLRPVTGQIAVAVLRPTAGGPDRDVARWVTENGGGVTLTVDGRERLDIESADELPERPFWLLKVNGPKGVRIPQEMLALIGQLPRVNELELSETQFANAHLAAWAAPKALPKLEALIVNRTPLNDQGLKHVVNLAGLQRLSMGQTDVTDAGVEHLTKLKRLRSLGLWQTSVTDDAAKTIGGLGTLHFLSVGGSKVTPKAIAQLAGNKELISLHMSSSGQIEARHLAPLETLPNLVAIQCYYSKLTPDAVQALGQMHELKELMTRRSEMGDAGVAQLKGLVLLRRLELTGAGISDEAIKTVATFGGLQRLRLDENPDITDDSVPLLMKLRALTELDLAGTSISPSGVAQLRKTLPGCKITNPDWLFDFVDRQKQPPKPTGSPIDLLSLVDIGRDAAPGDWTREEDALVSNPQGNTRVQIPYNPNGDYRLEATVQRLEGTNALLFGLNVNGSAILAIDGWPDRGWLSGPHLLAGQGLERHEGRCYRGRVVPDKTPVRLAITVQHGANSSESIRVERDGRHLFTWHGSRRYLSLHYKAKPVYPGVFSLRSWHTKFRVTALRLVPLDPNIAKPLAFADRQTDPERAAAQRVIWKRGELLADTGTPPPRRIDHMSGIPEKLTVTSIRAADSPYFSGADLAYFANLPELRRLELPGVAATTADVAKLGVLPKLEVLDLSRSRIDAGVMKHLPWMGLRELRLGGTPIADGDLNELVIWENLRELDLRYTALSDADLVLPLLRRLKQLERLNLDHTAVTSARLAPLAEAPKLADLSLVGTRVGDKAIDTLAEFTGLRRLNVMDTQLTEAGAERLKQKLPDCEVVTSFSETIDLLPLADLSWHRVRGRVSRKDGALAIERQEPALVMTPIEPPAEYDVEITARRTEGKDGFAVLLRGGGRQFLVEFDQYPHLGSYTVVDNIDGKRNKENESHAKLVAFPIGEEVKAVIQVRRDRVVIKRNGEVIVDWAADYNRVTLAGMWENPHPRALGVGSWFSGFVVSEFKLRPVTGRPRTIITRPTAATSERDVAERVLKLGGSVRVTTDGSNELEVAAPAELPQRPMWLLWVRRLGQQSLDEKMFQDFGRLRRLRFFNLENAKFDPAWLEHLAGLAEVDVHEINLNGTSVTDEHLKHFSSLVSLLRLRLGRTAVTGGGLQHLGGVSRLQLLQLGSSQVNSAGFAHVKQFKDLRHLDVAGAKIVDDDLAAVADLRQLWFLQLGFTGIGGSGLGHLEKLTKLDHLRLQHAKLTDDDLPRLAKLKSLTKLSLHGTAITDKGLPQLAPLTNLKELQLTGAKVSEAAARQLLKSLPGCQIELDGGVIK